MNMTRSEFIDACCRIDPKLQAARDAGAPFDVIHYMEGAAEHAFLERLENEDVDAVREALRYLKHEGILPEFTSLA